MWFREKRVRSFRAQTDDKRRGDSKVYHFKSFAPIDLKFWHNILEMLYYKKMQEKKIDFLKVLDPTPPPP